MRQDASSKKFKRLFWVWNIYGNKGKEQLNISKYKFRWKRLHYTFLFHIDLCTKFINKLL